jgi:hypothetical protein
MSFWGTLGKIALKVAPIAAAFIPGVGIPLAMAIGGATSAASKKIEGGSWKDALVAGGIGAGTSAVGAGALKGIGPTSGLLAKVGAGAAGKAAGTGAAGMVGSVLGNYGKSALTNALTSSPAGGSNSMAATSGLGPTAIPRAQANPTGPNIGGTMPRGGYGFQQNPMNQLNQNNPNLAQSIFQGREQAMKDQPFRAGYDVSWPGYIAPGSPAGTQIPYTTTRMPSISSDINYGQPRRPRWNYGQQQPQQQTNDGAVGG